VARLGRKQVEKIYEVRALLQAAIVRRFAVEASAENIAELRIYERLSVVRDQGDVAAIVNTTRQFSEYMIGVVDHELISDIHQKLTAHISVSRVFAISLPGRLQQSARACRGDERHRAPRCRGRRTEPDDLCPQRQRGGA
jgi:DNA-binding GntR family transcriptional regulator